MAELRKIVRNPGISNFRQGETEAGGAFRLLADTMDVAYSMLAPVAAEKLTAEGDAAGREWAKQQVGTNTFPTASAPLHADGDRHHDGVSPAAQAAFDKLQGAYGPLKVTSAYRSPEHNAKVGGAKNSQHTHGNAFDVNTAGMSQEQRVALIKQARAAGFRGIGVYDTSLHFDVAGDRAWGPSYGRDSLPAWAAEAVGAPVGGQEAVARAPTEPVMVRQSDGTVKARLYSPASGPLLQVYNAAAKAGYTAEIMNKGAVDLLDMQNTFLENPTGFKDAADAYIRQQTDSAPPELRGDIRSSLEKEAFQSYLGVVEKQQSLIRQRSANSVGALVDRWSDRYAEALASGDATGTASARAELDSALRAQETLPGSTWTPEQSQNVLLSAQSRADDFRRKQSSDQEKEWGRQLDAVISANRAGLSSAYDSIISDPNVIAAHPDKAREAAANIIAKPQMQRFNALPPDQRQKELTDLKSTAITAPWETDLITAYEKSDEQIRKDFKADPVSAARQYLPQKPPSVPDPQQDPQGFAAGLAARTAYVDGLVQGGYIKRAAYFDKTEADLISGYLAKGADPGIKLALAGAMVEAAGPQAAAMFQQLNASAPTRMAGMLLARGGDADTAQEIVLGEHMLETKTAQPPTSDERAGAITEDVRTALRTVGAPEADVLSAATAIWAANGGAIDMEQAVQKALGKGKNLNGDDTGGVQMIGGGRYGHPTLMPVDVAGDDLNAALDVAFGASYEMFGQTDLGAMWARAGASVPMKGGQPVPDWMWSSDKIVASPDPTNPEKFRLSLDTGEPLRDAAGNAFSFYPKKLIEAAE